MEANHPEKPQEDVIRVKGDGYQEEWKKPILGTALTGMVMSRLGDHGIPCWRQQAGISHGLKGGVMRLGIDGCADICAILPDGKMFQVEVKAGRDYQRKDQKSFQEMIEKNNGVYLIVRCVDDIDRFVVSYKSKLTSS